jgi:hypothetical protein
MLHLHAPLSAAFYTAGSAQNEGPHRLIFARPKIGRGRAMQAEQIPQLEANGNMAITLLRTFAVQTEALVKQRRGGEQTVRVEHVHVHAGGQAVVGIVNSHWTWRGWGQVQISEPYETKDQSARALAFAPGSPVWSANATRDTVPVESGQR